MNPVNTWGFFHFEMNVSNCLKLRRVVQMKQSHHVRLLGLFTRAKLHRQETPMLKMICASTLNIAPPTRPI